MKNSELLTTKRQALPPIEKQRQYVLRCLVQKNVCPNCGHALNFFEGAQVAVDDWEDKPGPTSCYVVPFLATGGNGGWNWHLVPIEREK